MELVRISTRDFLLCATYYVFPVRFLDLVVSNLKLSGEFLHDYHVVHSVAVNIFLFLFFVLFFIDVVLYTVSGWYLIKGVDYYEMMLDTIKESLVFSFLITIFSFIVAMFNAEADIVWLEPFRAFALIIIIALMYFMGLTRILHIFITRIRNVLREVGIL